MSSFTITNPAIQSEGLILGMRLTAATMTPPTEQAQQYIDVPAMIDTGATLTAIRDDIPGILGLKPVGDVLITTLTSAGVLCYQYPANVVFPNNTHVANFTVFSAIGNLDHSLKQDCDTISIRLKGDSDG